jgi:hypothetical protein
MDRTNAHRAGSVLLVSLLVLTTASRPGVAALSAGAGADYASGPGKQSVRDLIGYAQSVWTGGDVTVAGARFSSSQVGAGTSGTLALSWNATPQWSIQMVGAASAGGNGYGASRFQLGPVVAIGGGRTLGVYYTRAEDTISPSTKGLTSEVGFPASPSVLALARGSLAAVEGGGTSFRGSAGLIWAAAKRVIVLGELGIGRDAADLSIGSGAATGAGLLGQQPTSGRGYVSGPSFSAGVRYVIH